MSEDERDVREVIEAWTEGIRTGDLRILRRTIADDAVFLTPTHDPIRGHEALVDGLPPQADPPRFEVQSSIQEIQVCGEYAWVWHHLELTLASPRTTGARERRSGDVLTILKRHVDGR